MMLVVVAVALGLPAVAAAPQPRHPCTSTIRFDLELTANPVITCKTAQAVERYENSHETAGAVFYAGKREWLGTVYSRAHGHTYFVFVSPGARIGIVWITVRIGVS